MAGSMVLPDDVEQALLAALAAHLSGINIGAISLEDFGDDGQLVIDLPAVRVRYVGTDYSPSGDNQWLTYDVTHPFELWCAAENLTSKEAQRTATLLVVGQVLGLIAGGRLILPDGSVTEPVKLVNIGKLPDDILGTIFIVRVEIAGIAQFPGTLASGNEDD